MSRTSLNKLHKRLTRHQLEQRLGGQFEPINGQQNDSRRSNGRWSTWTIPNDAGRVLKLAGRQGVKFTALTWHDLGRQMGLVS